MTPRYELISFKGCPWVQRAAILLREKGADFDAVDLDPENRPDWFSSISPHGKVPVLRIDGETALFESNAITEFLDETIAPRLHPEDPVARAVNRAWTDWLPTFSGAIYGVYLAVDEERLDAARAALRSAFAKLEAALAQRSGGGTWFNGDQYCLVDSAYAPFLQRWRLLERLTGLAELAAFPLLDAWSVALLERPSTHSWTPAEFEEQFRTGFQKRGGCLAGRLEAAT